MNPQSQRTFYFAKPVRFIARRSKENSFSRIRKCWGSVCSAAFVLLAAVVVEQQEAFADLPFEQDPINYSKSQTDDPVYRLQKKLDDGAISFEYEEHFGYLRAVLKHLQVPVDSQSLVFSKTSFQRSKISPRTPRAIYFNDDMYVGFVQGGDVLELSAVDPKLGAIFYSLSQEKVASPKFVRHTDNCLVCHASSKTSDVPGHLVRSVFSDRVGQPIFSAGTFTTNHESPFRERWGGWYVTGRHGQMTHMGNVVSKNSSRPEEIDTAAGANVVDLKNKFDTSTYLSPHSDIVALMVLEHQTHMHNLITRAGFEGRMALAYNETMRKAFNEPAGHRLESVTRRLNHAAESLLEYLLFADEPSLENSVSGTSEFAKKFAKLGPSDSKGRSLRDFDLKTRLFRFPCSYLIHSEAFKNLPIEVKEPFYRKLFDILIDTNVKAPFEKLSLEDRRAIREILADTIKDLPAYWRS